MSQVTVNWIRGKSLSSADLSYWMFWSSPKAEPGLTLDLLSPQIWRHGPKDHHGEALRLRLLPERRAGHRPARPRHRVQFQPHLPPEPESREEASAEGTGLPHTCRVFLILRRLMMRGAAVLEQEVRLASSIWGWCGSQFRSR